MSVEEWMEWQTKKYHSGLTWLGEVTTCFAGVKFYGSPGRLREGRARVNEARLMKRKPRAPLQK